MAITITVNPIMVGFDGNLLSGAKPMLNLDTDGRLEHQSNPVSLDIQKNFLLLDPQRLEENPEKEIRRGMEHLESMHSVEEKIGDRMAIFEKNLLINPHETLARLKQQDDRGYFNSDMIERCALVEANTREFIRDGLPSGYSDILDHRNTQIIMVSGSDDEIESEYPGSQNTNEGVLYKRFGTYFVGKSTIYVENINSSFLDDIRLGQFGRNILVEEATHLIDEEGLPGGRFSARPEWENSARKEITNPEINLRREALVIDVGAGNDHFDSKRVQSYNTTLHPAELLPEAAKVEVRINYMQDCMASPEWQGGKLGKSERQDEINNLKIQFMEAFPETHPHFKKFLQEVKVRGEEIVEEKAAAILLGKGENELPADKKPAALDSPQDNFFAQARETMQSSLKNSAKPSSSSVNPYTNVRHGKSGEESRTQF